MLLIGCAAHDPLDEDTETGSEEVTEEVDSNGDSDTEQTREPFCPEETASSVPNEDVIFSGLEDGSFLCEPTGTGLVPAIVYHHGGLGQAIGGDLEGTCIALANAGYLAFSPYRPGKMNMPEHFQSSLDALPQFETTPEQIPIASASWGFPEAAFSLFSGPLNNRVICTRPL